MCADTPEYKHTLNLPRTDFPMRAGLPKREPEWLERWARIGVYDRLREKEGRKPFTLHDGPPYANGHLHIVNALNKTPLFRNALEGVLDIHKDAPLPSALVSAARSCRA